MSLLIDIQYFPPVDMFKMSIVQQHIIFEQYDRFRKMSFRNRCVISGANGLVSLTVPLIGGRDQRAQMKDVQIDYFEPWHRRHLKSLLSAYNKAPYFHYYFPDIEALLNSKEKFLFDLNLKIIECLFKSLEINVKVRFTEDFNISLNEENDWRNKILPKNFQKDGEYWKPKYLQVFENKFGFQPNLSILDLLFCEGPNAINLLHISNL